MSDILEQTYFHNTIQDYLIVFGSIVIGLLLVRSLKKLVLKKVKGWTQHTQNHFDDHIIESIERFGVPALYLVIIYFGITSLTLTEKAENILLIAITVAETILIVRFVSFLISMLLTSYVRRQHNGEEKVRQIGGLMLIVNIVIWAVGLIFLFDNMGYDVTAVIAGLGIGGIAVALAAQNILGDLFNYFVIFLDRPFEIGDFIVVQEKSGVVEYIGIKTTRVKSLSGEQLIFSNSDLTNSIIHNYKRMERRRAVFTIEIIYETPYEMIVKIPEILKSIVLQQEPVEFDRAHFASYGASSLNFEVVYYILDSGYNKFMDIQQAINLRIFEEFKKMDIEFAYPTQTLIVSNADGEEVKKASLSSRTSGL